MADCFLIASGSITTAVLHETLRETRSDRSDIVAPSPTVALTRCRNMKRVAIVSTDCRTWVFCTRPHPADVYLIGAPVGLDLGL